MADTLDHIEKTLADSYRKEIDQEENVWRTLPFFVAALSLEIAELTQLREQLGHLPRTPFIAVLTLGSLAFFSALLAVVYLLRSILPAGFKYVGAEPGMLHYAEQLAEMEASGNLTDGEALIQLKRTLAAQYAETTNNNRRINQSRVFMRSVAGAMTIASVLASLVLGAVTVGYQVTAIRAGGSPHGSATTESGREAGRVTPGELAPPGTPANPGRHEGSDGVAREHADPRRGKEGQ